MDETKPIQDFAMLGEVEQISSLSHKDRLAILARLGKTPKTGAEVAKELGLPANRVHYHLKRLLDQGLVEEVGKGRKRWKEERFYQSTARHFVVDPGLGVQDEKASAALRRSIESAFLDWRREELLNIDLAEVARRMVKQCLMAKPGENILVMHGPQGFDLAELLFVELEAAGCHAHSRLWSRQTLIGILNRHDEVALVNYAFMDPDVDRVLDGVLFISSTLQSGPPLNAEQFAKLPHVVESISRWQRSLHERRVRYLEFALPFRREFELGDFEPEKAIDIFWRCVETDMGQLADRARKILALMNGEAELHITCPLGTDLRMEVDLDRAFIGDGIVCPDDVAAGHSFEGLPAGTLNFFPKPASVQGVYRADYTFQAGAHIESVFLTIEKGRIVDYRAEKNLELLKQRLAAATGDFDLVSGLRFGLNPAGRGPTGKPILDACLSGAVTLHFGNNELQGGEVRSNVDLILPACYLTVKCGDVVLVQDGKLHEEIVGA